jgi:hypothetical protein
LSPLVGCGAVLLFSLTGGFAGGANFQSVLGVGLMVVAASTLVGAIVGFLFGLSRTVERPGAPAFMTSSTNLEQISDWLTKILVALGLVQLGKLAGSSHAAKPRGSRGRRWSCRP